MKKKKREKIPGTLHISDPEGPDTRAFEMTSDGVSELEIREGKGEMIPIAICPGGCHLLARYGEHGEVWGEIAPEAREHWAHLAEELNLPVRKP